MSYWFKHDENASQDDKLLDLRSEHGAEGYGVYWMVLEVLHQNGGVMQWQCKRLAFALQVQSDLLKCVVEDYDLFALDGDSFYSKRLLSELEAREEIAEKRRKAGAKGGKRKAIAKQVPSKTVPREEERREEDITPPTPYKGDLLDADFIEFWNLYDKKRDKDKCQKKWKRLNKDEKVRIFKHVPRYVAATPDKQYRKNPLTYLNGRCWEDEIEKPKRMTQEDVFRLSGLNPDGTPKL